MTESRSVLRRKAAIEGKPAPDFSKPAWMPDNGWIDQMIETNPYIVHGGACRDTAKSILKWLNEPCGIHAAWNMEFIEGLHFLDKESGLPYQLHRSSCKKCMAQFEKEIGEL